MTLGLCTDASSLLPPDDAGRLGVEIVPIEVALDGERRAGLGADEFYAALAAGAVATTSQPSPGDFASAYARLAAAGATEVLSLHLDARLSGTANAAELAAREASIPVTVLDTRTVSFGVALCVRAAAAAPSYPIRAVSRLAARLRNVFVAADAPGGRLEGVAGWNVYELRDGAAAPIASCRTAADAIAVMAEQVAAGGAAGAAVGHAAAPMAAPADALEAALDVPVERYRVEPPVGAHSGPLSFGAFWWPA